MDEYIETYREIMSKDYEDELVVDTLDEIYLIMCEDLNMDMPYSRRLLYHKFYDVLKNLKDGK